MNPAAQRWPLLILFLAVGFAALTGWSVYRASQDVSGVDPSYRQQPLLPPAADPHAAARG